MPTLTLKKLVGFDRESMYLLKSLSRESMTAVESLLRNRESSFDCWALANCTTVSAASSERLLCNFFVLMMCFKGNR